MEGRAIAMDKVKLRMRWLRSGLLGCLLGGLWGCGTVPPGDVVSLQPSAEWQTLRSATVQLELPPGYVGGEPGRQLAQLQATLAAWGFGDRSEWLAQNAEAIELIAFQQGTQRLNNISLVQAPRPDNLSVLDYINTQATQLQTAGITVEHIDQAGTVGALTVSRDGLWQTSYVYPAEANFWVITYSHSDRSETVLAQMERSRQSFQLLPEQP